MDREQIINLMHAEIDGIITAEEQRILNDNLEADAELKKLYLEIKGTAKVLSMASKVKEPSDLKANILNSIQTDKYKTANKINIFDRIFGGFKFKPQYVISYTAGLATGLAVLLLLVYNLGYFDKLDNQDISGSLVLPNSISEFSQIDRHQIDFPEINGDIAVSKTENELAIDITLQSEMELKFVTDFDSNQLFLQSFNQNSDGTDIVETGSGEIVIFHRGENGYKILLRNRLEMESQIIFKIYTDKLIYEVKSIINF